MCLDTFFWKYQRAIIEYLNQGHSTMLEQHTQNLATRGNKKYCAHLHHTLSALKRDFPASLVAPLPNLNQANLPFSNHTYTKSTPNHIHHHYTPSATPTHTTHTTHTISSTAPTYTVTPRFVDRLHWSDGAADQIERYAGWWTKIGMIGLPPQARVKGVGRHNNWICNMVIIIFISYYLYTHSNNI